MTEHKSIDVGELTEVVTTSVQRALQDRGGTEGFFLRPPRIIVGIIIEPPFLNEVVNE
jgi:hypothetical protein